LIDAGFLARACWRSFGGFAHARPRLAHRAARGAASSVRFGNRPCARRVLEKRQFFGAVPEMSPNPSNATPVVSKTPEWRCRLERQVGSVLIAWARSIGGGFLVLWASSSATTALVGRFVRRAAAGFYLGDHRLRALRNAMARPRHCSRPGPSTHHRLAEQGIFAAPI